MTTKLRDLAPEVLRRERARRSFEYFLTHVRVQDPGTDPIAWDFAWTHLVERARAWQAGRSEVILKARQEGLSWLAAAYALWYAMYRSEAMVIEISKTESDAFELLDRSKYIYRQLPEELRTPATVIKTALMRFQNGGRIITQPTTENAGRGYTANVVIVDEAASHAYAETNYRAYRPTIADTDGQLLMFSTGQGFAGFFHDLWLAAARRRVPYDAVFIDALARPDRDEYWYETERRAYEGDERGFRQEYPLSWQDAFRQAEGLVYPTFSRDTHVVRQHPVPWESCVGRYAGYDLGGGDPTCIGFFGVYFTAQGELRCHQYAEWWKQTGTVSVTELAEPLFLWHRGAPLAWVEGDPAPLGQTIVEELVAMGLPAEKAMNRREEGISVVNQFIEDRRLSIHQSCVYTIRDYENYRYQERKDGGKATLTRSTTKSHSDAMDMSRYALFRVNADMWNIRDIRTPVLRMKL